MSMKRKRQMKNLAAAAICALGSINGAEALGNPEKVEQSELNQNYRTDSGTTAGDVIRTGIIGATALGAAGMLGYGAYKGLEKLKSLGTDITNQLKKTDIEKKVQEYQWKNIQEKEELESIERKYGLNDNQIKNLRVLADFGNDPVSLEELDGILEDCQKDAKDWDLLKEIAKLDPVKIGTVAEPSGTTGSRGPSGKDKRIVGLVGWNDAEATMDKVAERLYQAIDGEMEQRMLAETMNRYAYNVKIYPDWEKLDVKYGYGNVLESKVPLLRFLKNWGGIRYRLDIKLQDEVMKSANPQYGTKKLIESAKNADIILVVCGKEYNGKKIASEGAVKLGENLAKMLVNMTAHGSGTGTVFDEDYKELEEKNRETNDVISWFKDNKNITEKVENLEKLEDTIKDHSDKIQKLMGFFRNNPNGPTEGPDQYERISDMPFNQDNEIEDEKYDKNENEKIQKESDSTKKKNSK